MIKKWAIGILGAAIISLGGMSAVQAEHGAPEKDCGNFSSGEEVFEFWTSHNYSADNDPERLDGIDNDGRPCESLTVNMVDQFAAYQSGTTESEEAPVEEEAAEEEAPADEDATEEASGSGESAEDEGDALPVTSTSYPTMMLFGLLTAGVGAFVLFRRKAAQA